MIQGIGIMKIKPGNLINNSFLTIGIIGAGFVGNAIKSSYNTGATLVIRDPAKGFNSTYEELKECEGIFICVPSPEAHDGSCDSSILEDVLSNLKDYSGVIISKVTATPDIYEQLQKSYPNLVYVPEFLTAANAVSDYQKENWAIIGGTVNAYVREAERIIKFSKPDILVSYTSIGEAALCKYAVNSFLATKVVFMNELSSLAEANGYNWSEIIPLINRDIRIGCSHMRVPGPDDFYGFGGMCFPKDTAALLKHASNKNVDLNVLNAAVKKNSLLRLKKFKD